MLEIKDLDISYGEHRAVQDFSLRMDKATICCLAGESGSGKTSVIRAVMGLLPSDGRVVKGDIVMDGRSLLNNSAADWRKVRGTDISMIFQDTGAMINPTRTIGKQYVDYILTHESITRHAAWDKAVKVLERMRLPDAERIMKSYSFQLSGGMMQRVGIAMAMTFQPKLLLADEPTSALDVTTQAQIVRQMMDLRDEYGTSILLVTHNLGVATYMSDYLIVMKDGRIDDEGSRKHFLTHEEHSHYTHGLLEAVPSLGGQRYV